MERPLTSSPPHNEVMANPVFDAVRTVMAIRDYQPKPIPPDVVTRIVDAGRLTASASNQQEWHFVVVREPENLRALGSLVRTGPYIAKSVLAIVVAYEKTSNTGISDCSRAIQSMLLTAWAEGVGSNWTGFGGLEGVRSKVALRSLRGARCPAFRVPGSAGQGTQETQAASGSRLGGALRHTLSWWRFVLEPRRSSDPLPVRAGPSSLRDVPRPLVNACRPV